MELAENQAESEFSYPGGRLAKVPGFGPVAVRYDSLRKGLSKTRPPLMARPANLLRVRADSDRLTGSLTGCYPIACEFEEGAFRSTTPTGYVGNSNSRHESRLRQIDDPKQGAHCFDEGPLRGEAWRIESCPRWMLNDFARTRAKNRHGLLNRNTYPISTGRLEGTNNKIRALSRQAYGFRDHDDFELQLYALRTTRYLLIV